MLDEGDIYVKYHMMVDARSDKPQGLFALRKSQVYLFTATMTPYWLKVVCALFEVGWRICMHTMKPALCVLSDVSTQFNIIGVTVQSVEELNTKLIAEMKAKAIRHPVIVF